MLYSLLEFHALFPWLGFLSPRRYFILYFSITFAGVLICVCVFCSQDSGVYPASRDYSHFFNVILSNISLLVFVVYICMLKRILSLSHSALLAKRFGFSLSYRGQSASEPVGSGYESSEVQYIGWINDK